jgi:hypothetical protein
MSLYEHKLMMDIYVDDIQLFQGNTHNDDIHLPKEKCLRRKENIMNLHSNVHPNDIEHN